MNTDQESRIPRARRRSRPRLCVAVGPREDLTFNAAAQAEHEDDDEHEPRVPGCFCAGHRPKQRGSADHNPSHFRTAISTEANCGAERAPNFRINFACGIVTKFWASKTPGRRKRALISTWKREALGLVCDQGDQRSILILSWRVDDKAGSDLRHVSEVDQPDLTSLWISH